MTEQEFWEFLEKLQEKGMAQQYSGVVECGGFPVPAYLSGHALLPKDYDKLSPEDVRAAERAERRPRPRLHQRDMAARTPPEFCRPRSRAR